MGDVNVEMALRLADRLGGHLMTGHVDGVGTVTRFDAVAGDAEGSFRLEIEAPAELARFIAAKGSIAVQGVSLTVNGVDGLTLSREPHSAHARGDDARGRSRPARASISKSTSSRGTSSGCTTPEARAMARCDPAPAVRRTGAMRHQSRLSSRHDTRCFGVGRRRA